MEKERERERERGERERERERWEREREREREQKKSDLLTFPNDPVSRAKNTLTVYPYRGIRPYLQKRDAWVQN